MPTKKKTATKKKSSKKVTAAAKPVGPQRTDVILVIDESSSMAYLAPTVVKSVNDYVASLRSAATAENSYRLSMVKFSDSVKLWRDFTDVHAVQPVVATYSGDGYRPNGNTALLDAMDKAIDLCGPGALDPDRAFLIIVLTDGQENCSVKASYKSVSDRIAMLNRQDRFTVVVNCPIGDALRFSGMGIAPGNVKPWEATVRGLETLSVANNSSLASYTSARGVGQTMTKSFYADTAGLTVTDVKSALDDITSVVNVKEMRTGDPEVIRDFFISKYGRYDIGRAFYELKKSEKVQAQKEIVILDESKQKYYTGWNAARQLLGLPATPGEIRLRPGRIGNFKVFIQSTSVNRKLKPGQRVLRIDR